MILGRSPALWVGLSAALLNVAVIVFGVPLTAEGVAAMNAAAVAIVAVLANEQDPRAVPTFAPTLTQRRAPATVTAGPGGAPDAASGRRYTDPAPVPPSTLPDPPVDPSQAPGGGS